MPRAAFFTKNSRSGKSQREEKKRWCFVSPFNAKLKIKKPSEKKPESRKYWYWYYKSKQDQ